MKKYPSLKIYAKNIKTDEYLTNSYRIVILDSSNNKLIDDYNYTNGKLIMDNNIVYDTYNIKLYPSNYYEKYIDFTINNKENTVEIELDPVPPITISIKDSSTGNDIENPILVEIYDEYNIIRYNNSTFNNNSIITPPSIQIGSVYKIVVNKENYLEGSVTFEMQENMPTISINLDPQN